MRVAQRMISRNYRRQVNSSLKKQADTLERSESGLKFKRLSDDVAAGSRAMHLQEERYQATQQLENTKDLIAEMKSVDSNMDSIHSVLQKVQERMLMGMSEDYGATAREVIAKEIHSAKEQILQFINNQFGGKYLFAGTNNSTQPFTANEDGKLCFNGIPVEQIYKSTTDGKYYYDKPVESKADDGTWVQIGTKLYLRDEKPDANGNITYTSTDTANPLTITMEKDAAGNEIWKDQAGTQIPAPTKVGVAEYNPDADGKSTLFATTNATTGETTYVNTAGTVQLVQNSDGVITSFLDTAVNYVWNAGPPETYTGNGVVYTKDNDGNFVEPGGNQLTLPQAPTATTSPAVVPNSGDTYADIGLGLKIAGDTTVDTRTAFQVSFSGLTLTGFAGYDKVETITGKRGTEVAGNIYDLLTQIEGALHPVMDKAGLDDMHDQLVALTDNVGLTRTDLGNRMQYLEQTKDRLDDDISDMTELETDLISSDPAEEAIKMKECEYVWLAVMQLGSKVLPASLLDFMS
ncbi:MAG: hypothetical protein HFF10_08550 [Angelakisella sp.]|jgi:flagellar hook-associated protein 3|nr:hypothetical protein [Angelakisella sp.]